MAQPAGTLAPSLAKSIEMQLAGLEEQVAANTESLPGLAGNSLRSASVIFHTRDWVRKLNGLNQFAQDERRRAFADISPDQWRVVGYWVAPIGSGFVKDVRDGANQTRWAGAAYGIGDVSIREEAGQYVAELVHVHSFDNGDHGGYNLRLQLTALFAMKGATNR